LGGVNTDVLSPSNTKPTEEKNERWKVRKRVPWGEVGFLFGYL